MAAPGWSNGAHQRALQRAITPLRMGSYLHAAGHEVGLATQLYIWDRDVAAALLADVAIVEVALRNALNDQLTAAYGPRWFEVDVGFDGPTRQSLAQAWGALPSGSQTPGHLVARLMLGFWKGLLEPGGYVGRAPQRFRADHEALWVHCLHRAFPGGRLMARAEGAQFTRSWTLETVTVVHAARNRAAHHEPFVNGFPLPGQRIRLEAQDAHQACLKLAGIIDRDLAGWLRTSTAVPGLLNDRPQSTS
ncbi:hypothetical protein E7Z53_06790 [Kocuria salina]|nr:hypothetical protein [Kocuria salina]